MAIINCPECGKEVSDRAKMCINCGCPIKDKTSEPQLLSENRKSIIQIIGLTVGLFFIFVGIIRIATAEADIYSASFGADFYTYTYKGIVEIAEILASIRVSLGWIIISIGAFIDIFVLLISKPNTSKKATAINTDNSDFGNDKINKLSDLKNQGLISEDDYKKAISEL